MQFLTWAKEFSISISFHPINLADTSVCFDMIYKLIVHFSVICRFPVSAKYSPVLTVLTRLPAAFSETARSADKMSKFHISQESAKVLNSLAPSPKQKATLFSSAVTVSPPASNWSTWALLHKHWISWIVATLNVWLHRKLYNIYYACGIELMSS